MATLYIFAGLPGTGKTTLSRRLAQRLGGVHLRIDTIEQALRDLFQAPVVAEGYRLAYRIAADNLRLGIDVVADSCNPIEVTRREWEQVARDSDASFVNIEVVCSDVGEHQRRVASRRSSIPGLQLPGWSDVERREYHPWSSGDRFIIETAGRSESECLKTLLDAVGSRP